MLLRQDFGPEADIYKKLRHERKTVREKQKNPLAKTSPRVPGNKNRLHDSSAKVSILKNDVQQNELVAKSAFQHSHSNALKSVIFSKTS